GGVMSSFDKLFKIGLLILGFGLLAVYAYHRNVSDVAINESQSHRFNLNVGNFGNSHVVYLTDTQEGTVYYAVSDADTLLDNKTLQWKVSNPKVEAKK